MPREVVNAKNVTGETVTGTRIPLRSARTSTGCMTKYGKLVVSLDVSSLEGPNVTKVWISSAQFGRLEDETQELRLLVNYQQQESVSRK
jgi:hypothetical protein